MFTPDQQRTIAAEVALVTGIPEDLIMVESDGRVFAWLLNMRQNGWVLTATDEWVEIDPSIFRDYQMLSWE